MAIIEADADVRTPFEQDVAATQRYFDSPRFDGIIRLYSARQVVEQRGTIPTDYIVAREAAAAFYARLRELFAAAQEHHHLRPLLARAGRDHEADGHRGDLPRWLGDVGEGLHQRGPRPRPGQLPAEPGARRGRRLWCAPCSPPTAISSTCACA